MKVKEIVRELALPPLRGNTLLRQRQELKLSRAALARILEVDPSSVYRQEQRDQMSMLWNYALRGIEAEAKTIELKRWRRDHKAELVRQDQLLGPSRLDAMGYKLTAEKMRETEREQTKQRPPRQEKLAQLPRKPQQLTPGCIKGVADRAAARSEASKKP
jgi:hypothetical protein